MTAVPPVDARLFASREPLRLAGSSCATCGTTTFPAQADCPRCARRTMADTVLPGRGVLWTWTIQAFEPRPPFVAPAGGFRPFPVGYVDLGDLIVEGRLDADPDELGIGLPMEVVPHELAGPDGPLLSYAFAPVRREA